MLGKRRWLSSSSSSSFSSSFTSFTSESNQDFEEKQRQERTEEAEEMLDRKQRELLEEEISAEEYGENPETKPAHLGSESVFFERRRDRVGGSRRHGEGNASNDTDAKERESWKIERRS